MIAAARRLGQRLHARYGAALAEVEGLRRLIFVCTLTVSALASLTVAAGAENPFLRPDATRWIPLLMLGWIATHPPFFLLGRRFPDATHLVFLYLGFAVITILYRHAAAPPFEALTMQLPQTYSLLFVGLLLLGFRPFIIYASGTCLVMLVLIASEYRDYWPPHGTNAAVWLLAHLLGLYLIGLLVSLVLNRHLRQLEQTKAQLASHNARLLQEVTEHVQIAKEQAERMHQGEKMEALGQLAGGLAHDVNNNLSVVATACDLLRDRLAGDPEASDDLAMIRRAVQQSSTLTRQLLAFARKGKIKSEPVDLHALIHELLAMLQRSLDRRIQVTADLAAPHAWVIGDAGQLESALLNLAFNARDAMPDGGELRFETALDDGAAPDGAGDTSAPADAAGRWLRVVVRDSGCGMDTATLAHIFEPFFTSKAPGQGTGLGLASAFGSISQHGGTLRATSEPARGSTFTIRLPATDPPALAPAALAGLPRATGAARILLVDDEDPLRTGLQRLLLRLGYQVQACASGEEALAYFRQHHGECDIVVLDQVMPGMTGQAVLRAMRAIDPEVRAVLVSGHIMGLSAEQLRADGFLDVLAKPIPIATLTERINALARPRRDPEATA